MQHELVRSVPRRPGQKEQRYLQLLGADHGASGVMAPSEDVEPIRTVVHESLPAADIRDVAGPQPTVAPAGELADLRERVARLEAELQELKAELGVGATP
jgi:uncharacterized protein YceH (UPF0502 family)